MEEYQRRLERTALSPLVQTGRGFYLLVGVLVGIILVALYAYSTQLDRGLIVTGMGSTQSKVMYGLYIVNFVFFIGISHAGTLISAILRVTKAGWRTPVTRMAEFITVVSIWEVAEQQEREARHISVPVFEPVPAIAGGSGVDRSAVEERKSTFSGGERR